MNASIVLPSLLAATVAADILRIVATTSRSAASTARGRRSPLPAHPSGLGDDHHAIHTHSGPRLLAIVQRAGGDLEGGLARSALAGQRTRLDLTLEMVRS